MCDYEPGTRRTTSTVGADVTQRTQLRSDARKDAANPVSPAARATMQLRRSLSQSPRVAQLARTAAALQRQAPEEEDLVQAKRASVVQRAGMEEEEVLQGKRGPVVQRAEQDAPQPNLTGMPDTLKSGIESLSGLDMSDVRVHTNSASPASVDALAYASGNEIHLGPGQERHLPHEAWHVVQQRQGRVVPTMQVGSVPVNDSPGLEAEADAMGARATSTIAQRRRVPGTAGS